MESNYVCLLIGAISFLAVAWLISNEITYRRNYKKEHKRLEKFMEDAKKSKK